MVSKLNLENVLKTTYNYSILFVFVRTLQYNEDKVIYLIQKKKKRFCFDVSPFVYCSKEVYE